MPKQIEKSIVLLKVACPLGVYYAPVGAKVDAMRARLVAYDGISIDSQKTELGQVNMLI